MGAKLLVCSIFLNNQNFAGQCQKWRQPLGLVHIPFCHPQSNLGEAWAATLIYVVWVGMQLLLFKPCDKMGQPEHESNITIEGAG